MEILTARLLAQSTELGGPKDDLRQADEQLADSVTQPSIWQHSQRQCEAALQKIEGTLVTLQMVNTVGLSPATPT